MLLLPLRSSLLLLFGPRASLRFFFGGLGLAPKEEKPIVVATMSSGGEGEREGEGEGMFGGWEGLCWLSGDG